MRAFVLPGGSGQSHACQQRDREGPNWQRWSLLCCRAVAGSVVLQKTPYKGRGNSYAMQWCHSLPEYLLELSRKRIGKRLAFLLVLFFFKEKLFKLYDSQILSFEICFSMKVDVSCPARPLRGRARASLPGLWVPLLCRTRGLMPAITHTQTHVVQSKTKPPINSYPIQTTGLKVVSLRCIPLTLPRLTSEISPYIWLLENEMVHRRALA